MSNFLADIRESAGQIKQVRALTGGAMLTALNLILNYTRIVVSSMLEISFAFLSLAVAGMLYGPVMAGIVGVIADTIGFFLSPNGGFFPGFTLSAFLSGFLFGVFFYKKKITLKRVVAASVCHMILFNFILTPIWLNIMYGSALMSSVRVIKAIACFPIDTALLFLVCKTVESVRLKSRAF
ncbi:folate family ECF transporter S component [Lachnospiraceae bacterium NSJ-143]|mgnify:CR=1 FL=1|nr:folate family ECF transporter S component [Lachnospiraceae bacterium NSJ-143]